MIRSVKASDAEEICNIYNYYIKNTTITFEEELKTTEEMRQRIEKVISQYRWLVYEHEGEIVAYAYAGEWKSRCAYRFSLEVTIYGSLDMPKRKGIALQLYQQLIDEIDSRVHSLIAVIALPNEASVGLHEKLGFEKVAHYKEVGFKLGEWIDVGSWQKML